jgi:hypothetical protein
VPATKKADSKARAQGKVAFPNMSMEKTATTTCWATPACMHSTTIPRLTYDEPRMSSMPVAPIVCVRAGMGLASQSPSRTSCRSVTAQRAKMSRR